MKIQNEQTTIYFAEPFHQVMKKIEVHQPVLMITNAQLYEYYYNTMPIYLGVEVSWYILPPSKEAPSLTLLSEIFQLCLDEGLQNCIIIGFGPVDIINLAGSFARVANFVSDLWLFPQNQAGLIKSLHDTFYLNFNGASKSFAVNITPRLVFFEEGIEPNAQKRLHTRQTDLLFLLLISLCQNKNNFKQLMTAYPDLTTLLKVSQLAFIEAEIQTLTVKSDEVDELLKIIFALKKVFQAHIHQDAEQLFALALLFYLFISDTENKLDLDMVHFKKWLAGLNFLPKLLTYQLSSKISGALPAKMKCLADFSQFKINSFTKKKWQSYLDDFFIFLT